MISVEEIRPLIASKLQSMGFELYDLVYHRAGRHSVLRVYVDKPAGVTIEDCGNASRELSVILDVEEFSNSPYSLEVSSPGLDRPLRFERDFLRIKGRPVVVELGVPVAGKRIVEGVVQDCANGVLRLACGGEVVDIALAGVTQGREQLPF